MWLRRAFFWWLFPAALVLPLWLLVGWIAFSASGWALLWVFIAMPAVLISQLLLALLVRARGSVRTDRAVSWWDVAGFGVWHALVIATGFYASGWYAAALIAALAAAVAVFWLSLWQLLREAAGGVRTVLHAADGTAYLPPAARPRPQQAPENVIVITERPSAE